MVNEMNIDDYSLWINFESSAGLADDLGIYSTCIDGTISCFDCGDNEQIAGKLRLIYLDLYTAYNAKEDVYGLFDMRSETEPFYSALFDIDTGAFKTEVEDLFGGEIWGTNLLVFDRLEILPKFRGKGIGPACIRRCLQQYAQGFDLVALKCFPLQFEPKQVSEREWRTKMKLEKFAKNRKKSFEKLKKYYGSVGFTLVPGTDFMVFYSG